MEKKEDGEGEEEQEVEEQKKEVQQEWRDGGQTDGHLGHLGQEGDVHLLTLRCEALEEGLVGPLGVEDGGLVTLGTEEQHTSDPGLRVPGSRYERETLNHLQTDENVKTNDDTNSTSLHRVRVIESTVALSPLIDRG